jgi:ABC-type oligopeptide transport system substrate-binding subunit
VFAPAPNARARDRAAAPLAPAVAPAPVLPVLALLCACFAAGCGPAGGARAEWFGDTSPPAGQVLTFNNGPEPELLDPAVMSGEPDGRLARLLFEGLCVNDPVTLEPRPGQADRWSVSADGRTYRFHLRPGLTWADGTPLNAQDFVWSWRRVLSPATGSRYASFLFPVKNAEAYAGGALADSTQLGLAAPDDTTFVVTLERPTPYFLFLTTFYTALPTPRARVEAGGARWAHPLRLVGNGPFRVTAWRPKDRIVLVPNERYWDRSSVRLERVVALAVDDNRTSTNLYKAGVIDWQPSGQVPKQVLPAIRRFRDFQGGPYHGLYFYSFAVGTPPLDNPWVRRALNLATDRATLARDVLKGTVRASGNMTPTGYAGYAAPPPVPYDPARARECLARAGYPGGRGFPRLEILFNTSEDNRLIAEALQAMWKRDLGIEVTLSNQEYASYMAATVARRYQVARRSWIGDYPDPMTFLSVWRSTDGNNRTGWSSPRYDALLRAAEDEVDPARRLGLLAEAERLLLDEGPVLPLYQYESAQLVKPYVRGIVPNVLEVHPLQGVWIDHGAGAAR